LTSTGENSPTTATSPSTTDITQLARSKWTTSIEHFGKSPNAHEQPFYLLDTFPGFSKFGIPSTGFLMDVSLSEQMPSIQPHLITPLLEFYHQKVTEFHFFCYHDYPQFYTRDLWEMITTKSDVRPDALRNAVAAFSALVYSTKNYSARELAFAYYDFAVVELRHSLAENVFIPEESHVHRAIATAMTLATFDVSPVSHEKIILISFAAIHRRCSQEF
jgi:hypothetical protein